MNLKEPFCVFICYVLYRLVRSVLELGDSRDHSGKDQTVVPSAALLLLGQIGGERAQIRTVCLQKEKFERRFPDRLLKRSGSFRKQLAADSQTQPKIREGLRERSVAALEVVVPASFVTWQRY